MGTKFIDLNFDLLFGTVLDKPVESKGKTLASKIPNRKKNLHQTLEKTAIVGETGL